MPTISTTLTLANSACFISRYQFKGVGGTAIGSSQPCGTSATHAYRKWTWIHWLVSKRWIAGTLLEIRRAMIPPNGSRTPLFYKQHSNTNNDAATSHHVAVGPGIWYSGPKPVWQRHCESKQYLMLCRGLWRRFQNLRRWVCYKAPSFGQFLCARGMWWWESN